MTPTDHDEHAAPDEPRRVTLSFTPSGKSVRVPAGVTVFDVEIVRIMPPSRMGFAMGLWACYMQIGMALAMVVAPPLIGLAGWP